MAFSHPGGTWHLVATSPWAARGCELLRLAFPCGSDSPARVSLEAEGFWCSVTGGRARGKEPLSSQKCAGNSDPQSLPARQTPRFREAWRCSALAGPTPSLGHLPPQQKTLPGAEDLLSKRGLLSMNKRRPQRGSRGQSNAVTLTHRVTGHAWHFVALHFLQTPNMLPGQRTSEQHTHTSAQSQRCSRTHSSRGDQMHPWGLAACNKPSRNSVSPAEQRLQQRTAESISSLGPAQAWGKWQTLRTRNAGWFLHTAISAGGKSKEKGEQTPQILTPGALVKELEKGPSTGVWMALEKGATCPAHRPGAQAAHKEACTKEEPSETAPSWVALTPAASVLPVPTWPPRVPPCNPKRVLSNRSHSSPMFIHVCVSNPKPEFGAQIYTSLYKNMRK